MFDLWRGRTPIRYSEVEDREKLLADESPTVKFEDPKRRTSSRLFSLSIHVVLFFIACGLGLYAGQQWHNDLDEICTRHVSQYSPVLHNVDVKYDVIRFNGSLLKENVFRGPAGPEVDTAWESLGVNYKSIRVPPELAKQSGLLPDQVKINPKYGGGFPANVEGLHQLHCLNLLRQSLAWNYDHYHALGNGAFKNDDHIIKVHVTHCLDIIRQQLMCTLDVGVLGQVWLDPSAPHAYVDFNTRHKCRNFDAIRQWAEANQLPDEADTPEDYLQPPEAGDRIYAEIP